MLRMLGRSCLRIGVALGGASCAGGFVDGSKVTAVVRDVSDRNVRGGDVLVAYVGAGDRVRRPSASVVERNDRRANVGRPVLACD